MKIAQIAPLAESVPPSLYGGTERVIAYLTQELVRGGHDVTLFASGESVTPAKLVACAPRATRLDPDVRDPAALLALMLERVRQRADEFDVLHFHIEHLHLPLFRPIGRKTVTTLHGRLDYAELKPLFEEFRDMPHVAISRSQRRQLPGANWAGTVYHGLAADVCPFNPAPRGDYLAFLGRASPEKGLEKAVRIACGAGRRLRAAAKVDAVDRQYFRDRVERSLKHPLVEFVGEVGEGEKAGFLGHATALLFPIDWPEPFGLAMIEAMSCGTPVIAFARGAVPEIVEDGVTGFVVDGVGEAVRAVSRAARLDRAAVRRRFEERFSAARMAREYLDVYRALAGKPVLSAA